MALLTQDQLSRMLINGQARVGGRPLDAVPVAKLYTPDAAAAWLLTELADDGDEAFGLCDSGLGMPELVYVRLSELENIRGPRGMRIAVDPQFRGRQALSQYLADALRDGSITD